MGNFFINLINFIISAVGTVLSAIFSIFPSSPFTIISNSPIEQYLPTLNYFIPVREIIVICELWLTSVAIYYIYQIILRWLKAVK